jgi:predicted PP-loop superfamily ATPase
MAIDNYRSANGRQAIGLRFHPIADCHQMLCDAVAEKRHELTIQNLHM